MNKEFIIQCINEVEDIQEGTVLTISKDGEELNYQVNLTEYGDYELQCLEDEDAIWDDGDTIEELKQNLICSAVRNQYQRLKRN